MRLLRKRYLLTLALLPVLSMPCYADIYAFVDSNGVRHISNVPNDPRYRLIRRTPKYSKRPTSSKKSATASQKVGGTRGWQQLNPKTVAISPPIKPRINWGLGRLAKPFAVNETNRKRFAREIQLIAGKHRLPPALLHAVISAESAFNPKAVSKAGAMGLMQLMPATARRFGVRNPFDPVANMHGGARYLRWLLDRFKNLRLALAAYNAGEAAVERYGNKIPPYKETQTYVSRVLQFYNSYR